MPESFKVTAESSGFKDLAGEIRDTAKAMTEAAKADAELQKQAKEAKKERYVTGPAQRLLEIEKQIASVRSMGDTAQRRAIEADLQRAKERAERIINPPEKIKKEAAYRFLGGPNQRIQRIQEELERAQGIADPATRGAVSRDLEQALFRARRSHIINERRIAQGDTATSAPGLLDLFQDLNGLLKSGLRGDVAGSFKALGAGVRLFHQEGAGGLNIEQKLGSALGQVARASQGQVAVSAGVAGAEALSEGAGGAAGLAAELAPVAIAAVGLAAALAVTIKGIEVFGRELAETTGRVNAFGNARILSGGTSAEVARLGALGVENVAGDARSFRDRLEHDQLAQVTAARLGVPMARPSAYGGPVNDAQFLERALIGLRKITDAEEQLREARILGLESMLPLLRVSEQVFQLQMREARERERIYDPRTLQSARDLAAGADLFGKELEDLKDSFLKPAIPEAEKRINGLNAALERLVPYAEALGKEAGDFANELLNSATGGLWGALGRMAGMGGSTAADAQVAAQDRNTAALEYVAAMLEKNDYNVGPRGGSVLPSQFKGNKPMEEDWLRWHANRTAGPW